MPRTCTRLFAVLAGLGVLGGIAPVAAQQPPQPAPVASDDGTYAWPGVALGLAGGVILGQLLGGSHELGSLPVHTIAGGLAGVAIGGLIGSLIPKTTPATVPQLRPGDRVRVTTASSSIEKQVATVTSLPAGAIALLLPADSSKPAAARQTIVVPLDSIARLDVSRGVRSYATPGAFFGAISLGLLGGYLGSRPPCGGFIIDRCLSNGALDAVLGAGLGAVIGAGIGGSIHTDRWAPVVISPPRAALLLRPGRRVLVGASLAF